MKKTFFSFITISISIFFLFSCKKNSTSHSCSGVIIIVNGTTVDATTNDGSILATATGSTGFMFNINGGTFQSSVNFNNLVPGSYTVTAKDVNGCTGSKSFTIAHSKTYFITQSSWKFDNAKVSGIDVSGLLQTCEKDNVLVFAAAGTGSLDEGPAKCNSGDPQTSPFTWNFAGNETVLHVSTVLFAGGNSDFNLVTLTDTQLVLSQNIAVSGSAQNAVVTFKH